MIRLEAATAAALIEALDQGREGHPRWIVATCRREPLVEAAASRGYVPVSIEGYARARILERSELQGRALLLIDDGGDPCRAHAALMHAAANAPRPHLLLTLRGAVARLPLVRESRAAYTPRATECDPPQIVELLARASRAAEFVASGRHAAAERLLREVAAALARRGARAHAARVTIQLGRVLAERGRSKAALDAFEDAASVAQTAGQGALVIEARVWQATVRMSEAAFIEAEAICRAALESPRLEPAVVTWTRAVLTETLLWQEKLDDVPNLDLEALVPLDRTMAAYALEVQVRWLLARDQIFEAGRAVARLKTVLPDSAAVLHADLAVVAATGDLVRAGAALDAVMNAVRTAKEPFRAAWVRLLWVDTLRHAGRDDAAGPHLRRLKRVARAAPLLLRREIERRLAGEHVARARKRPPSAPAPLAIALLRIAHEEEADKEAVHQVLARLAEELHTSRIDLLSDAAGPATVLCSTGDGLPTTLGPRALEAGFAIGPERHAAGCELAMPVRVGTRFIGVVVCRWPIDRSVPAVSSELIELAAAVIAPRLDAVRTTGHDEARAATAVPELLGVSEAIANVRKAIVRAAGAPFAVLIEGESGVGKELAARAVHQLSARRERRFCDLNCAALPEELLESELFGHVRGAFSGAVVDRAGLFEEADGGTLLLDEVADLSPRAQAKLLRAIQQQEIRRVGESFSRRIDVRIVAAANRDMRAEAAAGRFRRDLLYRLDVIRIQIPPLRERPADIPVLAEHCWHTVIARTGSKARLSPATLTHLSRYHWPGNVRELQNVVASLAVAAPPRGWVRPELLAPTIGTATTVSSGRLAEAREQFERRFIEVALARAGGNRAQAARALGLSRQGLLKILIRLGMSTSHERT